MTAMPVPAVDSGADGVAPEAAAVAGHGASVTQVGRVHVSSALHVAVELGAQQRAS